MSLLPSAGEDRMSLLPSAGEDRMSLLPSAGEGGMSLLPSAGEGGRRPDEGACGLKAGVNPHPLGSRPRDPSDLSRPRER